MSVLVTVHLGPAVSLDTRRVKVTRHAKAGDDTMPSAYVNELLAGDVESVSIVLPVNQIWRLELTDTRLSGEISETEVLYFNTGSLQFPGPRQHRIAILSIEEMSSSSPSSNSSSSISTSSSSVSTSSSSISTSSSQSSSDSSQSPSSQSSSLSSSSFSSRSSGSSLSSQSSPSSASTSSSSSSSGSSASSQSSSSGSSNSSQSSNSSSESSVSSQSSSSSGSSNSSSSQSSLSSQSSSSASTSSNSSNSSSSSSRSSASSPSSNSSSSSSSSSSSPSSKSTSSSSSSSSSRSSQSSSSQSSVSSPSSNSSSSSLSSSSSRSSASSQSSSSSSANAVLIGSVAILTADWTNFDKSLATTVGISGVGGDILFGKRADSLGIITGSTAPAVPIAYEDFPDSVLSSAIGIFTLSNDYGSPEPDQTINVYAVKYNLETSFTVSGLAGPVTFSIPATPLMGAYPSGTQVSTPNLASLINAITAGSWAPGDKLLLIFRSTATESYTTNARLFKRITTSFQLDYTV